MTIEDWNTCDDAQELLGWLQSIGKLTDRKARLFAVACCRRVWSLVADERCRKAVETAELYADNVASSEELLSAGDAAFAASTEYDLKTIQPSWLTPQVVALAQAVYDDRAFDRMAELGAALVAAGCDNGEVFGHCHEQGSHVRGCWVVDLLLGKA